MVPLLALLTVAVLDTTVATPPPRIPSPVELGRLRQEEPSEAYYRRLKVHRWSSYAMLPLFAFQYAAGAELFEKGDAAADWAQSFHGVGAAAIGSVFAVNLVTGVPNVIEIWNEPRDRKRRLLHASTMLVAAAGFTATGLLADRAEDGPAGRRLHRGVALGSMGLATISYLSMLDFFRSK
jgi:Na+/H+ antiporter NhaA